MRGERENRVKEESKGRELWQKEAGEREESKERKKRMIERERQQGERRVE